MNPIDLLNSPVANALGWTLLHALWQGFALVLPTAVVLHLLRGRSSALRYRIGVLTLLSQLLISAATFVAYYQPAQAYTSLRTADTIRQPLSVRWQMLPQALPWHQQVQQFLENHLSQFVFAYLIGLVIFGLRLAGGWLYLRQLSQTAVQPATQRLTTLTEKLRVALSLRAMVQVRESARIAVPMVVGTLKPILLIPVSLVSGLSLSEMEAVLAHELAHVKRHDYTVNLLQSAMEVLYFFHPALWWLSGRVREEREHCCDDLAVQACGGNGWILAQALARVEELRTHYDSPTPALAMALASKRRLLLHRVQRMLGVSTRPVVSNGSLAGLTLATLLLVSISVYAVQQEQPKPPKASIIQPKPTRRHKVDSHSEYGMADNKKISYVIWKGRKLPASRVAKLQHQLDQVMAGQLSLDNVPQPNRDILLTIIEKNNSFDAGMGALADGLSHIDYNNIVASALNNVPLSPDGTVEGLKDVDYGRIIKDAFASIPQGALVADSIPANKKVDGAFTYHFDDAERTKHRAYEQRQMDSLSQLIAQRSQKSQALRLQMEKMRFPIEELERSREVLDWRKDKLMEQRNILIEKHQRLLRNDGKQKLTQVDIEKQLAALEPEIKRQEVSVETLNKQLEELQSKQEEAREPMEKLEKQAEQLEEQIGQLSDQIGQHGDAFAKLMPEIPEVPETPEAPENLARPARAPRPPKALRGTIPPTPAIAPLSPYKVIEGTIVKPAKPVAPVRLKVSASSPPKVAPAPRPAPAVAPIPPK